MSLAGPFSVKPCLRASRGAFLVIHVNFLSGGFADIVFDNGFGSSVQLLVFWSVGFSRVSNPGEFLESEKVLCCNDRPSL